MIGPLVWTVESVVLCTNILLAEAPFVSVARKVQQQLMIRLIYIYTNESIWHVILAL